MTKVGSANTFTREKTRFLFQSSLKLLVQLVLDLSSFEILRSLAKNGLSDCLKIRTADQVGSSDHNFRKEIRHVLIAVIGS